MEDESLASGDPVGQKVDHNSEEQPQVRIELPVHRQESQQRAVVLPTVISGPVRERIDVPAQPLTEMVMVCSPAQFLPSLGSSNSAAPWMSSPHGPMTFFKQSEFWNPNTAPSPTCWWPHSFSAYVAPSGSTPFYRMFHAVGPPTWAAPMLPPHVLTPNFSPFGNRFPLLISKGGDPRIIPVQVAAPRMMMMASSGSPVIQCGIPVSNEDESSRFDTTTISKKDEEIQTTEPKTDKKGKARRKKTRKHYWTQKKTSRKRISDGGQEGTTSSYEEEEEGTWCDEETDGESGASSIGEPGEDGDTEILREAQRLLVTCHQRKPGRPPKKRPRSPSFELRKGRKKKKVEDGNAAYRWNGREDFEWHSTRRETRAFRRQKLEAKMKEALKKSAEEMEEEAEGEDDSPVLPFRKRTNHVIEDEDEAEATETTPTSVTTVPSRCDFCDGEKASRSCNPEDGKEEETLRDEGKEAKTRGEGDQWRPESLTPKAGPTTSTPTRRREWTNLPPARRLLCMDSSPILPPNPVNEWRIDRLRGLLGRKLSTLMDDVKMSIPDEDVSCTDSETSPTAPVTEWLGAEIAADFH